MKLKRMLSAIMVMALMVTCLVTVPDTAKAAGESPEVSLTIIKGQTSVSNLKKAKQSSYYKGTITAISGASAEIPVYAYFRTDYKNNTVSVVAVQSAARFTANGTTWVTFRNDYLEIGREYYICASMDRGSRFDRTGFGCNFSPY